MIRRALRAVGRLALLVGWAPVGVACCTLPLGLPTRWRVGATRRGARLAARGAMAALGVRVVVHGARGYRRDTPTLFVANHLSWLDIVIGLSTLQCTFVAKREIDRWPIVGPVARALGVIYVDRHRKRDVLRSIPALEAAFARGESVLLFPEGTTTDGRDVLPFRSALFEAAVRQHAPVTPLAFSTSARRGEGARLCWIDAQSLLAHFPRIATLERATMHLRIGEQIVPPRVASVHGAYRKTLSRDARQMVIDMRAAPMPDLPAREMALVHASAANPSRGECTQQRVDRLAMAEPSGA